MAFDNYDYSGTLVSEQFNTLLLLDCVFAKHKEIARPVFHILGGTALLFHGIEAVVTIDIDVANRLTDEVRELVDPLLNDNASEVAVLPESYEKRLIPYKPDVFKNMSVYILSAEDLVITKLGASRHKDIEDLARTDILKRCDLTKVRELLVKEFNSKECDRMLRQLDAIT